MRPITVSVTMPPSGALATAVTSAVPNGAFPQQLPLTGAPAGGSNVSTWVGTASVAGNVLTVVTTTSGAMGPGRLSGSNLPPDIAVTGPGPTAGTWLLSRATQAPLVTQPMRVGTVITFDAPRQLSVTNTSDPLGANTYTIYGTNAAGQPISEQIVSTGAGIPMQTVQNFATVTQVVAAVGLGNLTSVGVAGVPTSPWVMFDPYADVASITKNVTITGGPTWTIQITNDDPNSPTNPVPTSLVTWQPDPDATFVNATGAHIGSWAFVPLWARMILASASPAGSAAAATFVQQGGAF